MFLLELNWIAILVAFVAAFIAGAIWFGPKTFFPAWWRAMGKDPNNMEVTGNMAVTFGATAIAAFIEAVTVASVIYFVAQSNPNFGFLEGGLVGLLLGLGLAAASSLSHRLFAGQGFKVWILEVGSDVVNLTIMGLIIGAWR
ncbi:DUF1761 domain-containing protein [Aurantimicrobium minutum]|uniref:Putative membrane protein CrgA n=1 Tax=Aurantimicrobium minutum TaxID=708131 RepID=A0A173LX68_9MICO|nr:DUF1761 domain-containing protein [Aurantimicrobium minutum]BAU99452.1 putative membrane protein CrgA [Aurantimicrobium minutum]